MLCCYLLHAVRLIRVSTELPASGDMAPVLYTAKKLTVGSLECCLTKCCRALRQKVAPAAMLPSCLGLLDSNSLPYGCSAFRLTGALQLQSVCWLPTGGRPVAGRLQ